MNKNKGFTLIELLAVIIILGIILLIAIPSVTNSINSSRKKSFADNAKTIINSAIIEVNTGDYDMYDPDTTYYIPISCIKTESGGSRSTFGSNWDKEYVAVTYTGDGYDFYYTGVDANKNGTYLTYSNLLDGSFVRHNIDNLPTTIGVGERSTIVIFDEENCEKGEPVLAELLIDDKDYYDPDRGVYYFHLNDPCTFNGTTGVITGCGRYNGKTYIDTGLKLYSEENYKKDYEISFDVVSYVPSEQTETQATILECKLETGKFPGLYIRRYNNDLEIGHKIGNDKKTTKKKASQVSLVKVIRKDNVIYYSFGDQPLTKLQDMTNFKDYFDKTLWIGAAEDENGHPFRNTKFVIDNLNVKLERYSVDDMEESLHTAFSLDRCTFNGDGQPITDCGEHNGQNYIDTGISLYGENTSSKNFIISFKVENVPTNENDTDYRSIITDKLESNDKPGITLRKKKGTFEVSHTAGNNTQTRTAKVSTLESVKIYRQNGSIYYSINDGVIEKLQTVMNYNEYFDDSLFIGAARDSDGNPYRFFKGTIKDLVIKTS